jgi:Tfp pilus assembly protein PilN
MRPVNLIPPEERRGDSRASEGTRAYALVGLLGVILLAVVAMVLTGNKIADREAELTTLQAREDAARARAEALAPYAQFASLSQSRNATVSSLAKSRFDWERVLRELALVIPDDVWLVSTSGTVAPDIQVEGSSGNPLRAQAPGPALELIGCAPGQDSVAAFVAALKDIDGVTRVGLSSSELPDASAAGASGGASGASGGDDCRTRDFIARFEIVVAFDAVPAPAEAGAIVPETGTVPATTAPAADAAAAAVPGAEETATAEQQARDSAARQTSRGEKATNIIPGSGE